MQRLLYIFLLLFIFFSGNGQILPEKIGARAAALGHAVVALNQEQAFFYNPAGMEGSILAASFQSPQNMGFLATSSLHFQLENKDELVLAVGAERFGDSYYHQSKLSFAANKKVNRVRLGLKGSWFVASVPEVSSAGAFLMEFGVLAELSPRVKAGLHAYNMLGASLFETQQIPTLLRTGLCWGITDKFRFLSELEGVLNKGIWIKSGLEYQVKEVLSLRSGLETLTQSLHFGIGFSPKKLGVDYAVSTHPSLGLFHHLSLNYKLNE